MHKNLLKNTIKHLYLPPPYNILWYTNGDLEICSQSPLN